MPHNKMGENIESSNATVVIVSDSR